MAGSVAGLAPVLVIGPGAIGGLVAARLAAAGHPVVAACRTEATARRLRREGVTALDPAGRVVEGRVDAVVRPIRLDPAPHLAVLATKCADAEPALQAWLPVLPRACPIVAMQNGVMGDVLASMARGRLLEAVVTFPATLETAGRSVQTGPGGFVLGAWGGQNSVAVHSAARILRAAGPVRVTRNVRGAKWTKLLINSAITTLGALTNAELGALLTHPKARDAFRAVVREGYAAGRAEGVRFEPVAGFRPGLFAALPRAPAHLLLRLLGRKYRRHKSSSLQSLERGRATEVDFLNGVIVETARRNGASATVNEALVRLVHEIEAGQRKAAFANLDALFPLSE